MRSVATLAELDLTDVLGFALSPETATELAGLDGRLDQLERESRKRYGWLVGSGERQIALGPHPTGVLGRVLSYPSAPDDLLELSLDVWRVDGRTLLVGSTLEVNCFCPVDHNVHRAAEEEWTARGEVEVRNAMTAAVVALEGWSGLSLDAEQWRSRCGLPTRDGAR